MTVWENSIKINDMAFVHLHTHSQYSVNGSMIAVDSLLDRSDEYGFPAVALTDTGTLAGVPDFLSRADNYFPDIKPIIGCELEFGIKEPVQLVLLARNPEGYRNLVLLISRINLNGDIPWTDLKRWHSGLVCLIGFINFSRSSNLAAKAKDLKSIFGDDLYVESVATPLFSKDSGKSASVETAYSLAGQISAKVVATNDCRHLSKEDGLANEILFHHSDKAGEKEGRTVMGSALLDEYAMRKLFKDHPDAIDASAEIAGKIERFRIRQCSESPAPREGINDSDAKLKVLVMKGARAIYGEITQEISGRIDLELSAIASCGYSEYILMVHDLVEYLKKRKIMVGPGRGWSAGSLVNFCLGITGIDPLENGLKFECFCNSEIKKKPNIVVEVDEDGLMMSYRFLQERIGKENVAFLTEYEKMDAEDALLISGEYSGLSKGEISRLERSLPEGLSEETGKLSFKDLDTRGLGKVLDCAKRLEGIIFRINLDSVFLAGQNLKEALPLRKIRSERCGSLRHCQYENIFINLKTQSTHVIQTEDLQIIKETVRSIEKSLHKKIDIENIFPADEAVLEMFRNGETKYITGFEEDETRNCLMKCNSLTFNQLCTFYNLFLPTRDHKMFRHYIARLNGREACVCPLPAMEPYLKETFGILIYDEQLINIIMDLAGFSSGKAIKTIKAMRLNNSEKLKGLHQEFLDGGNMNGHPEEVLEKLWSGWLKESKTTVMKAHSVSMTLISCQLAWLKCHFPDEFLSIARKHMTM